MALPGADQHREPDWPAYMAARAESSKDVRLRRFFEAWKLDAQTPMEQVPLVALDMETTGLDATRHGIVSLGVVPFDLRRIRLAEKRYWVVRPRQTLSARSVTFHHITHSQIADAPDLEEVLEPLLAALAGRVVVVHYRNIERNFLDVAIRRRLEERLLFPMIDTMQLEARLHRRRRWAWARRLAGFPPTSIRLYASRQRYGLPFYQGHHALSDALACAELLQAQIATHYTPQTPLTDLWC